MPISAAEPLLAVKGLRAGYGKIGVLHGVDLTIGRARWSRCSARTAPARPRCCARYPDCCRGRPARCVRRRRDLRGVGPRETARRGLVHVIEGHRVFTQLSVTDNLLLAGYDMPRAERVARVDEALAFFPEIAAKRHDRGGALSGGQQQMLAVAQGLVRRPRLLMLDEPSAGLSPVLVDRVLAVARQLRDNGTAILLVEQLIEKALALADRVCALRTGAHRAGGADDRTRPAAPAGTCVFRPGCADRDPLVTS